ncbi:flagellar hook-length control protein FliK [Accumulibacter sp.]|uniref:flagellar hook-length control protein FliK n=1 Tax=Accumulibacter sp. TaxID=2053492 RepID=UPI0025CC4B52|nr:flagellar hook-length control protein FliK [Accumulibacter sp.]MCM8612561.1 flagellar hook-length control protein FliK [Accumulibacter sp.]MCM8636177.1 flagellar hook-length control protein FliK [Accumulibacter sp.]MCM8639879.1 flagellar hook-length control protein FliK [Accumulibacter sp.]
MIRTDFANRLQPAADLALRPTPPAQEIADRLTGLVVGQRLLAEIQALLPNGSYRAMINQRSVTLALPFAAQTGDAIELEVAETDGRLTLAVVAGGRTAAADGESAATTLSRTGQLIGNLLVDGSRSGRNGGSQPLPLNENQPLAPSPPRQGQDLLPLLQQAISRSGMFYEAHQAQWIDGRHAKAQLLAEPQGRLSPLQADTATPAHVVLAEEPAMRTASGIPPALPAREAGNAPPLGQASTPAPSPVAPQAQAIVQQQLEAFATQVYSWQGQVWPGQDIRWEIGNPPERQGAAAADDDAPWQTRLLLSMPLLGELDARLSLVGERLSIAVTAARPEAIALLRDGSTVLRQQMEQAGIALTGVSFAERTATGEDARLVR